MRTLINDEICGESTDLKERTESVDVADFVKVGVGCSVRRCGIK